MIASGYTEILMTNEFLRIPSGNGELDVALHRPAAPKAWVVTLHGLESNKEGSKYFALAERLDPLGIGVVRFDFRGCGVSTGDFAGTNVATRVDDALAVLNRASTWPGGHRLGLFGSSMGGYVGFFVAAHARWRNRLGAFVSLASPENLDDLMGPALQHMAPMHAFVEEYRTGGYRAVPAGVANVLLLHGERDDVVPVAHAQRIWDGLSEPRKMRIFPGGDHRFSSLGDLGVALDESTAWFRRLLS